MELLTIKREEVSISLEVLLLLFNAELLLLLVLLLMLFRWLSCCGRIDWACAPYEMRCEGGCCICCGEADGTDGTLLGDMCDVGGDPDGIPESAICVICDGGGDPDGVPSCIGWMGTCWCCICCGCCFAGSGCDASIVGSDHAYASEGDGNDTFAGTAEAACASSTMEPGTKPALLYGYAKELPAVAVGCSGGARLRLMLFGACGCCI